MQCSNNGVSTFAFQCSGHALNAADSDAMLLAPCFVCCSNQRLYLMGPQHTVTQLRIRFMGLRRPQHGGSSEKVLLVSKSFVVTSARQCLLPL